MLEDANARTGTVGTSVIIISTIRSRLAEEHSPVDEEEEKAFRRQVATAFDAVARDADFQEDLRRRSAESSAPTATTERSEGEAARPRIAEDDATDHVTDPHHAELWRRAIKLPMYSVALAPLAVAGALCHHWYGCVNVPQWGALATGACLVIAWLNLSNDAWDAATGVDDSKPESVVRLLGGDESEDARKAAVNKVHAIALGCLALGAGGLCYAATQLAANATADVVYTVLAMLGAAVACRHMYQGPPFGSATRVGRAPVLCAFGPLATGVLPRARGGVPGVACGWACRRLRRCFSPGCSARRCWWVSRPPPSCSPRTSTRRRAIAPPGRSPQSSGSVRKAIDVLRGGVLFHHFLASFLAFNGWLPVMGAVGVLSPCRCPSARARSPLDTRMRRRCSFGPSTARRGGTWRTRRCSRWGAGWTRGWFGTGTGPGVGAGRAVRVRGGWGEGPGAPETAPVNGIIQKELNH